MAITQHLAILFALVASILAASNQSLCLKGCCGLQLELPSSYLSFSNPSAKEAQAVIGLEHIDTGIKCCPCEDSVDSSTDTQPIAALNSVLGTEGTATNGALAQ